MIFISYQWAAVERCLRRFMQLADENPDQGGGWTPFGEKLGVRDIVKSFSKDTYKKRRESDVCMASNLFFVCAMNAPSRVAHVFSYSTLDLFTVLPHRPHVCSRTYACFPRSGARLQAVERRAPCAGPRRLSGAGAAAACHRVQAPVGPGGEGQLRRSARERGAR